MRNDDPLDALIDDTARSLTEGAPSPSMRVAIRERIAAPRKGVPHVLRPFTGRLVWTGAAAAAAVLLIVTLGHDEAPAPLVPVAPPSVAEGPSPAAPVVPVAPAAPDAPNVAAPRRRIAAASVATVALETATLEPAATVQEDALVIELVEIEPLAPEPLELELMEVPMPLRAERIEIEPLPVE